MKLCKLEFENQKFEIDNSVFCLYNAERVQDVRLQISLIIIKNGDFRVKNGRIR